MLHYKLIENILVVFSPEPITGTDFFREKIHFSVKINEKWLKKVQNEAKKLESTYKKIRSF